VSDIDTAAVDSLKALDPEQPIREADKMLQCRECPLWAICGQRERTDCRTLLPILLRQRVPNKGTTIKFDL